MPWLADGAVPRSVRGRRRRRHRGLLAGRRHAIFVERDARAVPALRDNVDAPRPSRPGPGPARRRRARRGALGRRGSASRSSSWIRPTTAELVPPRWRRSREGAVATRARWSCPALRRSRRPPRRRSALAGADAPLRGDDLDFLSSGRCRRLSPSRPTPESRSSERRGTLVGKRAVYPGMFDPMHNGHLDLIERSLRIFDELIVAVVANPSKQPLFTVNERLEMIDEATAGMRAACASSSFDGLLIDLVAREQADCIVRGIRAVSDFEYEFQMALMNRKLRPPWRRCSSCPTRGTRTSRRASSRKSPARRPRDRHGAAGRREAPHRRSSRESPGGRIAMLADRLKTLAPSPTLAVQAKAKAMRAAGHRRDLLRRRRARLRHAGADQGRGDPRAMRARPHEVHRGRRHPRAARRRLREAQARPWARLRAGRGAGLLRGQAHALQHRHGAGEPGRRGADPEPLLGLVPGAGAPARRRAGAGAPRRRRPGSTSTPPRSGAPSPRAPSSSCSTARATPPARCSRRRPSPRWPSLAVERDLWVVSDECYEALTYEGRHVSIASLGPEVKARTIVVNTCSKAYAMTGWRIGYAAGPRDLIKAMTDVQSQVTSNPSSIAQWAAVEALTGPQDEVAKMAGEFDRRRRVIVDGLNAVPGVRCTMPKGAFYAFPNVSGLFGKRAKGGVLRGSADVCAVPARRRAHRDRGGGRLRIRRPHPALVRDRARDDPTEGLARMDAAVRALEGERAMKIEGSSDIAAPREKVWAAFLDPATSPRPFPAARSSRRSAPESTRPS